MNKKLLKTFGIILGVMAIIFSFVIFGQNLGYRQGLITYGGDAYTGIQNASASAANNILSVGKMLSFALGSQMLLFGLAILFVSLCIRVDDQDSATHSFKVPEIKVPEIKVPDIKVPDIKVPDIKVPDIKIPEIKAPSISIGRKSSTEWKCRKCGTTNTKASHFCYACGNPQK